MGILTDIYNTVAKFFRPQEEQNDASKSVATNRLKLVLMQDRTNLTPKILEQMRGELIDLLSRYVEMDKELLELNFEQEGDQVALMLSIPVIRAKDEEEIEAACAKLNEENAEESSETVCEEAEGDENTEEYADITEEVSETEEMSVSEEETAEKKTKKKSRKVSNPEGMNETERPEEPQDVVFDNSEA